MEQFGLVQPVQSATTRGGVGHCQGQAGIAVTQGHDAPAVFVGQVRDAAGKKAFDHLGRRGVETEDLGTFRGVVADIVFDGQQADRAATAHQIGQHLVGVGRAVVDDHHGAQVHGGQSGDHRHR